MIILLLICLGAFGSVSASGQSWIMPNAQPHHGKHYLFNVPLDEVKKVQQSKISQVKEMLERNKSIFLDKKNRMLYPEELRPEIVRVIKQMQKSLRTYLKILNKEEFRGLFGRQSLILIFDSLINFSEIQKRISIFLDKNYSPFKYKLFRAKKTPKKMADRMAKFVTKTILHKGYRSNLFEAEEPLPKGKPKKLSNQETPKDEEKERQSEDVVKVWKPLTILEIADAKKKEKKTKQKVPRKSKKQRELEEEEVAEVLYPEDLIEKDVTEDMADAFDLKEKEVEKKVKNGVPAGMSPHAFHPAVNEGPVAHAYINPMTSEPVKPVTIDGSNPQQIIKPVGMPMMIAPYPPSSMATVGAQQITMDPQDASNMVRMLMMAPYPQFSTPGQAHESNTAATMMPIMMAPQPTAQKSASNSENSEN